MAFRATNDIHATALAEAKNIARQLASLATGTRDAMAAGNTSANLALQLLRQTVTALGRWNAIKAIPGIGQYAKDQENDQTYDVVAEFNAMIAAAEALRDTIVAGIPKANAPAGVAGRTAVETINADGTISVVAFTPAQTAGVRADIDGFLATVI